MEILGIGPLELLFILLIALIVLGPNDMAKAGRTLGRMMRKVIDSPEWRTVQKASRELRYLPNRLMREASMEDVSKDLADINKIGSELKSDIKKAEFDLSSWTTPPDTTEVPSNPSEAGATPTSTDLPKASSPPENHS